jgi:hypothetical protein
VALRRADVCPGVPASWYERPVYMRHAAERRR